MKQLIEVVKKVLSETDSFIHVLETGTIRVTDGSSRTHYSTFKVAGELKARGDLTSIDRDEGNIEFASKVCLEFSNIAWVHGESLKILPSLTQNYYDIFLIDSDNDAEHCLKEFLYGINLVKDGGYIVIDDAGLPIVNEDSLVHPVKGHAIFRHLQSRGKEEVIMSTTGYQLVIKVKKDYLL